MSRGFEVRPVSREQVMRFRDQGMGIDPARRLARFDNLESAIHEAKDVEDLKICLLGLLHLSVPK
jgi:hypothetical protein